MNDAGQTQEELAQRQRTGILAGFGAYALWGLLPLYFKAMHGVSPVEMVAHRVVWSVAFLILIIAAFRLYPALIAACRQPRIVAALALCAVLIGANWLIYIWAVDSNHIVAASLGYFLNPLVNVLLGTMVLKEKLGRGQAISVGIAATGVAILAVGEWQTLWISLSLAITFGIYGLIRKLTPVPAAVGLGIETALLAPPALIILALFAANGTLMFGQGTALTLGLIAAGAITSIPLLLFAVAARQLPMVTLGLMQYVAPTLQFLSGIFLFGEKLSPERWASFMLIWAALALFIWDSLRGMKRK